MNLRLGAGIAALTLALTITGCSYNEGEVIKNNETATATTAAPTTASPTPAQAANPTFGDSYEWPDGLKVTVSQPEPFTPSEYAAGTTDGWDNLAWTVTIENGTDENFDPIDIWINVASGGQEGSEVYDSDNGYGDYPESTVLPGKSITWNVAYSIADPNDLQLSIEDTFGDYPEAIYTN